MSEESKTNDQVTTGQSERTFTQAELEKILQHEKEAAKRSTRQEVTQMLTEKFGGRSVDEIETILKQVDEAKEAQKTQLQRLEDELAATKRAGVEASAQAQAESRQNLVKLQLIRAGVHAGVGDDGVDPLDRLVPLVQGATIEEINADIVAIKEQFPGLVAASPSNLPDSMPSGTPPPNSGVGESPVDAARREAQERNKARGVIPPA